MFTPEQTRLVLWWYAVSMKTEGSSLTLALFAE